MDPLYVASPYKPSFVYYTGLLISFFSNIIFFALIVAGLITGIFAFVIIGLVMMIIVCGVVFITRTIRFHKTRLEFYEDHLVMRYGTLTSEATKTIPIRNITAVHIVNPWIESKLFGTGTLRIQAAGSGLVEVRLESTLYTEELYAYVRSVMQKNGYSLQKDRLLQQETPMKAAVILSVLQYVVILVFFGLAWIIGLFLSSEVLLILPIATVLVVAIVAVMITDLLRKAYFVYDDCIEYTEGFLTRRKHLLPAEKLVDVNIQQSFIDRIIGSHNVTVQTIQGVILFYHMPRAEVLENNIERISQRKLADKQQSTSQEVSKQTTTPTSSLVTRRRVKGGFTGVYKQHLPRVIAQQVLLAILILVVSVAVYVALPDLWLGVVIVSVIALGYTVFYAVSNAVKSQAVTYEVVADGIHETYAILKKEKKEISNEHVVFLRAKQGFIDRFFNVKTVVVKADNQSRIEFLHVRKHEELISGLQKKFSFVSKEVARIPSRYSVWLELSRVSNKFLLLLAGVAALLLLSPHIMNSSFVELLLVELPVLRLAAFTVAAVIALRIVAWIVLLFTNYFSYKEADLVVGEAHYAYSYGWLRKQWFWMRQQDHLVTAAQSYPFTRDGSLVLLSAGRGVIAGKYFRDVHKLLDEIDKRVFSVADEFTKPLLTVRAQLRNAVLSNVLLFPLMPFRVWAQSKKRYRLEKQRVVGCSGVFYKNKKSVLYKRVDHLAVKQGLVNKLSHNASIHVYTISNFATLRLEDLQEAEQVQQELYQHYAQQ